MRYTLLATSKGLVGYLIGPMLKPSEAAASGKVWAQARSGQQVRQGTEPPIWTPDPRQIGGGGASGGGPRSPANRGWGASGGGPPIVGVCRAARWYDALVFEVKYDATRLERNIIYMG